MIGLVKGVFLFVWTLLFVAAVTHYQGSWLTYTVFSVTFLAMLASGFYRQISYGYLFLVGMLWLGFWFKVTIHLLVDYPFGEPVGFFNGTAGEWDEVLKVATVGSLGVMVARLLYSLAGTSSSMITKNDVFKAPAWYPGIRKWLWAGLVFVCIGLALLNIQLGIHQVGLVPSTILMWPFNAVISWLLGGGLALCIATLLWWDIILGRNISSVVYFILLESFSSSVSLLSRGTYIFHAIPQILGIYANRTRVAVWSRKNIIIFCIVFILMFMISLPLVNTLRAYHYSNVTPVWNGVSVLSEKSAGSEVSEVSAADLGKNASILVKFAVDRWIGTEGVMAVAAFPEKSDDLFFRGLTERREIGKTTVYQEICQAHYRFMDMNKFQFASLPGAVAFLYFTGSLWVVILGMIVLTLTLLASEGLVFRLTSNPLLCTLWGMAAANAVAQMGIDPRGGLTYFFEMSFGVAVIWFVQSRFFSSVMQRSNNFIRNMKSNG